MGNGVGQVGHRDSILWEYQDIRRITRSKTLNVPPWRGSVLVTQVLALLAAATYDTPNLYELEDAKMFLKMLLTPT